MKIHQKQIPQGGTILVQGETTPEDLDLTTTDFRPLGPLRYDLEAGISEGGLFATGRLEVEMELTCVACLEKFAFPVLLENFALHIELTGPECIDLTPVAREDILLALPPYPHCDVDGGKTCPASFPSVDTPPAERKPEESQPVWDALDKIKKR